MVYWRIYLIKYLTTPGVWSICLEEPHDIEAFIRKFYDQARKDTYSIKRELRKTLDAMTEDKYVTKEEVWTRYEKGKPSVKQKVYRLTLKGWRVKHI